MSNEIVRANATGTVASQPKKKPVDALKSILNAQSVQAQFSNALAESKDLFVASIIDLFNNDRSLQECDPKLVVSEALKAAVMRLPISKALGFGYIVVYKNKRKERNAQGQLVDVFVPTPTFIPGYKGYIQLAQRTGSYKTINANVVYEGQLVEEDLLSGEIRLDGSKKVSDKVIGYFAHFKLLNGFSKTLYMSVPEMARYAKKFSPGIGKMTVEELETLANAPVSGKGVGWSGNFESMALKTCIRRLLSKYGILSIEMQTALASEIEADQSAAAMQMDDGCQMQTINLSNENFEDAEVVDVESGEIKDEPENKPDF